MHINIALLQNISCKTYMNDSRICECIRRTGVGAGPDGEQILKLNEGKCIEREI